MEGQLPRPSVFARMRFACLLVALVAILLAVDGAVSRTEALDRWTGTAVISANGLSAPVNFIVLVNPGVGASWEWRVGSVVLGSGPLAAPVSGANVSGQLFLTGGLTFEPNAIFLPCGFRGTIAGNQVQGTFDETSCGGSGNFVLVKQ
jgi:hypothetical protein